MAHLFKNISAKMQQNIMEPLKTTSAIVGESVAICFYFLLDCHEITS